MEKIAMESMNIQLPAADIKLLKELSKKMGWITKKSNVKSKSSLDLAIQDINEGKVETFNNVKEVMDFLGE